MRFEKLEIKKAWNGQPKIELVLPRNIAEQVQELNNIDPTKYEFEIKKIKKRRSANSNAYAWVLMQKIAEKINSTRDEVYMQMLKRYSRSFTHIIVKANAVDQVKEIWRTVIDLGEVVVNGQKGHQLQCFYGSSTFTQEEMSVFLNGIVDECKELGIQTLTPDEIDHMNSMWRSNGQDER